MTDRGERPRRKVRRQGAREDEARGKAADIVAERGRASDIAAHHAEGFGQRALDQGQAIAEAVALADAAATRPVEANSVDLVDIGYGTELVGNVAEGGDRGDIAVHRINRHEGD